MQNKGKHKKSNPLAVARRILALIFFTGIVLLFLDASGVLHKYLGWMAKVQLLPAVMALNVAVVLLLVVLTLLFGRIYCSVICPMGVFQDLISKLSSKRKGKKYRFRFRSEKKWLRYPVLLLFVIAIVAGAMPLAALIAPYSAFGRMVSSVHAHNILSIVIAASTFLIIFIFAWTGGRAYCNSICPVGTVLGLLSRFSLFKIRIDESKCNSCGLCEKSCKASCIDSAAHKIDHSRCVDCLNCLEVCNHGAISFAAKKKSTAKENAPDSGRRAFLAAGVATLSSIGLNAQEKKVDGGLAIIEEKKAPERKCPVLPAGAQGIKHMSQHCTACQLCVSSCPNAVLRPSSKLENLMQPEASFENGYCRPECTRCSEVCPSGAIQRISKEEKSSIQTGHAVLIKENCLPFKDGVKCGNCARHCPAGAIYMVKADPSRNDSPMIPSIDTERCIGCGACEYLCPSRPLSAIYVEGHERHRII